MSKLGNKLFHRNISLHFSSSCDIFYFLTILCLTSFFLFKLFHFKKIDFRKITFKKSEIKNCVLKENLQKVKKKIEKFILIFCSFSSFCFFYKPLKKRRKKLSTSKQSSFSPIFNDDIFLLNTWRKIDVDVTSDRTNVLNYIKEKISNAFSTEIDILHFLKKQEKQEK